MSAGRVWPLCPKAKGIMILEKGHTQMEVDSVHANLEHMWDKQPADEKVL